MKSKVCTKCEVDKPISEFNKRRYTKDGLRYQCKSCINEYNYNMCPFKKWFINKKGHAKNKGSRHGGIEFTIEPTDIPGVKIEWYNLGGRGSKDTWKAIEYPKVCPVLRIELDWGMNGRQPNSPSLDRINPKFGYIKGNVMMISDLANSMKNSATPEQLKQFSEYHLSHPQLDTNPNQISLL
jgi:hypothetical protein